MVVQLYLFIIYKGWTQYYFGKLIFFLCGFRTQNLLILNHPVYFLAARVQKYQYIGLYYFILTEFKQNAWYHCKQTATLKNHCTLNLTKETLNVWGFFFLRCNTFFCFPISFWSFHHHLYFFYLYIFFQLWVAPPTVHFAHVFYWFTVQTQVFELLHISCSPSSGLQYIQFELKLQILH